MADCPQPPDWKSPAPPAPPGACGPPKPSPTDKGWAGLVEQYGYGMWVMHGSEFKPRPTFEASMEVDYDPEEEIWPLEGTTPSDWKEDGGKRDGEIGGKIPGIDAKLAAAFDWKRYKREYECIKLQKFKHIHVKLRIWWDWSYKPWVNNHDYTFNFDFWCPVGEPFVQQKKAAYRWRQTSRKVDASGSFLDKFKLNEEIPNPPPKDAPKGGHPDDYNPKHENPYPKGELKLSRATLFPEGDEFASYLRDSSRELGISPDGKNTESEFASLLMAPSQIGVFGPISARWELHSEESTWFSSVDIVAAAERDREASPNDSQGLLAEIERLRAHVARMNQPAGAPPKK